MLTLIRKIRKYFSRYTVYKFYYNKYSKYEYLSEKHKNLHIYENLLEKDNSLKSHETQQLITFHRKLKFNDSKNIVKRRLGNPMYQITNTKNEDIDIFFYKIQIGKQKIRCETHFHKNDLILFTYHFPYIKSKESKMMFSFINEKYGLDKYNTFPIKIKDSNNKTLIISKHVGVSLNYVDTSHHFFNILKDHISERNLYLEQNDIQLKRFYSSL